VGAFDWLAAVSASSPTDAWAVGFYQTSLSGGPRTLTFHWDGTAWTSVPSPNPSTSQNNLYAVSDGPGGTWAVGAYLDGDWKTLALQLVEGSWVQVPTPNPGKFPSGSLFGVAGFSAKRVTAVGTRDFGGSGNGFAEGWDGEAWQLLAKPRAPDASFNALAAAPSGDLMAAGVDPSGAIGAHWSRGSGWTSSRVALPPDEFGKFVGVAWSSDTTAWAVGETENSDGSKTRTLIASWDGSAWTVVPSIDPDPTSSGLVAVTTASGQAWAVGGYGHSGSGGPMIESYC
jgi:hypothetical protein